MSGKPITINIDGVEVNAQPGQTIIQAADEAGVYIPRLCHHPSLPPGGHCRICTVKVDGRLVSACTFPVSHGLVIENETEELTERRRTIIEMLFVEGNHFCPSCEASGNCELQAMGYRLGMVAPTFGLLNRSHDLDATHKDVYIDRDRCILCGRCSRASRELDDKHVFGFEGRGINKRITVDGVKGLSETQLAATDQAAGICPTGCLTLKREGFKTPVGGRTYDHQAIGTEISTKSKNGNS